ncbi:hypothetical protein DdX_17975 [Ditylenchus destructor]|uniref:Uncharacterized protein n=1 Tax=Ditylenchus destructor TaxID=166010 RepID=A0AAD4ML56_9BILA|nr:hypothetical protein DdX_17975 [Ditylenchus destructor]
MDDSVTGNMSSPPKNGTNASAEQNIDKRSSDEYEIVDNDLSTLEASMEHCNAFAETRDKPEASNESSKNTAHDLGVTLQKQETEKQSEVRQIESLQMNRSSVGGFLPPEYKRGRRNRTKDEPETMFDQRIRTALLVRFKNDHF